MRPIPELFRAILFSSYGIHLRLRIRARPCSQSLNAVANLWAVTSLPFPLKRGKLPRSRRGRIFLVESGAIIYALHLDHAAQLEEA